MTQPVAVVTGAFSYTGRAIAHELLVRGHVVKTLTRRPPEPGGFGDSVQAFPFTFDDPPKLVEVLRGAETVYNTYWVRFERRRVGFSAAVTNTKTLIQASLEAGVRRFVHISITNPSSSSSLPYFRGKALVEDAVVQSGLSYAIVRPSVIFGRGDVFINNIAWILRRFPVFAIPGDGSYRIQPVHVDDVARLSVELGTTPQEVVRDAAGPEIFTFEEMVRTIAFAIGRPRRLIHCPPVAALAMARLIGLLVRDVVLTRQELEGLMANLVVSSEDPIGQIRLTDWLRENSENLGRQYASEIGRNFKRPAETGDRGNAHHDGT